MRLLCLLLLGCWGTLCAQSPDCLVTAIERPHGLPQTLIERGGTMYSLAHRGDTLLESSALKLHIVVPRGIRSEDFPAYLKNALADAGLATSKFTFLRIIYFDYNSALIRNDASAELDKLVNLMNRYPFAEINIVVHTDSRGTPKYNQDLAKRRGASITEYLSTANVPLTNVRLSASGEEEKLTDCPDPSSCDELMHQFNRRAEFLFNPLPKK